MYNEFEEIQPHYKISPSQAFKMTLFFICLIGMVMVYSSSYMYSKEVMGSSVYFFIRQVVYIILGISLAYFVSRSKFKFWMDNAYFINFIFTVAVALTFVPWIGSSANGAHRWLRLGPLTLQPGEFLKYSMILTSLNYFEKFFEYDSKQRLIKFGLLVLPLILLIIQPDFGTFTICSFVIAFVCFLSRFPRKYFYSIVVSGGIGVLAILFIAPYRVQRILAFLDPWKDPRNSGFQIIQSYLAFANGSILGQGIGNSNEKLFYLPEAYNDFIFSVIGEELGFVGVIFIIILFLNLIYWGFKIAIESSSRIIMIFISSIVVLVGFQAFLNMGVVLGLLPTKGLNLPFISYGGSSLLANFMAIGLIFSAKKQSDKFFNQINGVDTSVQNTINQTQSTSTQDPQQRFWP